MVGTDPVAVDSTGLRIIEAKRRGYFQKERVPEIPAQHIRVAQDKYGLGIADPDRIRIERIGPMEDASDLMSDNPVTCSTAMKSRVLKIGSSVTVGRLIEKRRSGSFAGSIVNNIHRKKLHSTRKYPKRFFPLSRGTFTQSPLSEE